MTRHGEAPGPAPPSPEAVRAFNAIRDRLGSGEATTARLVELLLKDGLAADEEAALRALEALWTKGFIYCANAVRGVWKVTRP